MVDSEDIPICLTSEEYQKLTSSLQELQQQKGNLERELAHAHVVKQKETAELAKALQAQNIKSLAADTKIADLNNRTLELQTRLASQAQTLEASRQQLASESNKITEITRIGDGLRKDLETQKKRANALQKTVCQLKGTNQALVQELESHKTQENLKELSNEQQQLVSQQRIKQLQESMSKCQQLNQELATKVKVMEVRMESKEEFVCNYYQSMGQKLSDFDQSQVQEIIIHDMNDFIGYMTKKAQGLGTNK